MADLKTEVLPLLPLTTGVVLPHMVVTLALETEEAKAAVEAARSTDGVVLLVPRAGSGYARIGTVGKVEDSGRLPSGIDALVVRGMHRGVIATGVPGTGRATWVEVERR
ncbi:MAG TPA: LON peptidase substrate-binding domain-containing protein, partial [Actinomycetota bacterium]|nr:LON peptidase substrate-binding domain-containing protein [Actinomycetota bacterium]